jgi:hypothetical protein
MDWNHLCLDAGQLGSASKAGGSMGRRPMGAQGRGLGLDAGSLAISRGGTGVGFGPIATIETSCIDKPRTMHEVPNSFFLIVFPDWRGFEGIIFRLIPSRDVVS